jgi:hypothetical protein
MNKENIGLGSTWKNTLVPRGKCHNKTETKTTVSLYLDKNLVEKARNRSLNLSRITEQALSSILDYVQAQEIKTSLSFLTEGFFSKETSWAGRSVWYDRHVGIVEVLGSNPGPST